MTIRAGVYRESVAVDEPTDTQDDSGAVTTEWTQRAIIRAEIKPLRGRERLQQSGGIAADFDAKLYTHWAPFWDSVTPKWRLRHLDKGGTTDDGKAGHPYNIVGIANVDMRNHEIEIAVNSGLNQG